MDIQILEDCDRLALAGKMTFPESIERMISIGIERYRADLVRMEKTHYTAEGECGIVRMEVANAPAVTEQFNAAGIREALVAIQSRKIDYGEFLRQIMHAGAAEYSVWLRGRVSIYFGRAGELYTDQFPGRK